MYPVTLVWPGDLQNVGCVLGQFERRDGRIWATYNTREELAWALAPMIKGEMARLERRMEVGLGKLRECKDEGLGERLLAQWDRLMGRYQVLVEGLAVVMAALEGDDGRE